MKPIMKKIIYAAFIIGTLVIVLCMAFHSGDLATSVQTMRNMSPGYVGMGVLLTFGAIFAQTLSARSAIRAMGHNIGLFDMFRISILGEFYCYVTPGASGGQPMVIYQMHKRKVPVGSATSAQLVHHLCFQFMLMVITTVLAIAYRGFVFEQVGSKLPVLVFGYCFNLAVVILTAFLCFTRKPVRWAIERIVLIAERLRIKKLAGMRDTMLETADQFYTATQVLKRNRKEMLKQLCFGALRVISHTSVIYCVYRGFGLSAFSYGNLLAMSVMLYTSAAYTPLPGASGAQEGVFGMYFASMLPGSQLYSGLLAWRFITYYLVLAVGAAVTLNLGTHRRSSLTADIPAALHTADRPQEHKIKLPAEKLAA